MNSNKREIIAGVILIAFSLFLLNPFDIWMAPMMVYLASAIVLAVFVVYFGLIMKEKPLDEREEAHLMTASRTGYLAGIISLAVIFLYQAFTTSHPSKEVTLVIVIMILAKLVGFAISKKRM